jgi:hypothetical protein
MTGIIPGAHRKRQVVRPREMPHRKNARRAGARSVIRGGNPVVDIYIKPTIVPINSYTKKAQKNGLMGGKVISMGCEIPVSHFIDEDQAEHQLEASESHLRAEEARGRPVAEARRLLARAREILRRGLFTKAFFLAIQVRGIALEKVGP